jgi:hypothetical protein
MPEFHATPAYRDQRRLHADYRAFHQLALETCDVDPVYPVYRRLASDLGLSASGRAWLVFVHVAYYHIGSALKAFDVARRSSDAMLAPLDVPVGTERRAHWSRPKLAQHLAAVDNAARPFGGDLDAWAREGLPEDPREAWRALADRLQRLTGNGRWAAFKTAEMLQQICDVPVAAPDMDHANSSGPRQGLSLLYKGLPTGNTPRAVATLDKHSEALMEALRKAGLEAEQETTETTLCDFHALHGGRYYVGHDIDQMLHQLNQVPSDLTEAALDARADTLPAAYRGEINGWHGIDKNRRGHYRRTGEVISR